MAPTALAPAPLPSRPAPRAVDTTALQRVRARLAAGPQAPWLHAEVARRMAERLPVIRHQPRRVLDWWPASGASAELLRRAYPRTPCQPVWPPGVPLPAAAAPRWWSPRRWRPDAAAARPAVGAPWAGAIAPLAAEALPAAAGDLLWANMSLHWCADPLVEMRRWHEVLEVDGFLMFSTLGPGTLASLRTLYRAQGWGSPHAAFVDMHDLGDMLVEAGFADPVMDQETLTLTWPDPAAALAELRTLGANVDPARHAGLRTPRWRDRLQAALAAAASTPPPGPTRGAAPAAAPDAVSGAGPRAAAPGRVALDFEVVYGHAFRPRPRPRVAARTTVGLEDMRSILRARPEQ